jgi:hypothetical protein
MFGQAETRGAQEVESALRQGRKLITRCHATYSTSDNKAAHEKCRNQLHKILRLQHLNAAAYRKRRSPSKTSSYKITYLLKKLNVGNIYLQPCWYRFAACLLPLYIPS